MARQFKIPNWACHLKARRGTPATGTKANDGRGTPTPGRGMLVAFFREGETRPTIWACHLVSKAWHASLKGLGMPLESQAWHATITNHPREDLGVPLEFWAWHAKQRSQAHEGRGMPNPRRATLVQLSRDIDQAHS
ncbi:hypothetical protein AHAS_Ahas14G0135300 [Arachis hypogaea]